MLVYQYYSLLDPVGGKPCFGLEEWKVMKSANENNDQLYL